MSRKSVAFHDHQGGCAQCQKYDPEKPATLAYVCLRGAPLAKDWIAEQQSYLRRKAAVARSKGRPAA